MVGPSERLQASNERASVIAAAPRITLDNLLGKVARTSFIRVGEDGVDPDGILTICVLAMQNGFFVTGTSAPASPENFDEEVGKQNAFDQAVSEAWKLEGYSLRERLYRESAA